MLVCVCGEGGAGVVSVNLCLVPTPAQDFSLTEITNMTPGHGTLATVPELSSSVSRRLKKREPLNTDYYAASLLCGKKYGLATVDNSKWASVFGVCGCVSEGEREGELAQRLMQFAVMQTVSVDRF